MLLLLGSTCICHTCIGINININTVQVMVTNEKTTPPPHTHTYAPRWREANLLARAGLLLGSIDVISLISGPWVKSPKLY